MTKDEILKKHEDKNEYHFHQVDREWIMESMEEYHQEQLALCNVSNRRKLLEAFTENCNRYRTTMEEITPEEILKETLNLKGEITEKDYWMTVKVKDCLEAINKALAISRVVGRSEQLCKHKRVIKSRLRMEAGKSKYCKDCKEWLT